MGGGGGLKIFEEKGWIFCGGGYVGGERRKVKGGRRDKKKVNVMKKRIEIGEDLKGGLGWGGRGIKNWVKWWVVGLVVYVGVGLVCGFWGGIVGMLGVLGVVVLVMGGVWWMVWVVGVLMVGVWVIV